MLAQKLLLTTGVTISAPLRLASAGYLHYEALEGRSALPHEHVPSIARRPGPFFVCGGLQMLKEA
jgi:hypothetical protein